MWVYACVASKITPVSHCNHGGIAHVLIIPQATTILRLKINLQCSESYRARELIRGANVQIASFRDISVLLSLRRMEEKMRSRQCSNKWCT